MNDGYLLADCVIKHLVDTGFIHASDWRHNTKELYYPVSFLIVGTRASTISLEINVSSGRHIITRSIVRALERRFSRDFTEVFSLCLVA
jgi:hypothetical protein